MGRCGKWEGGGRKLAKMCGHPLRMIPTEICVSSYIDTENGLYLELEIRSDLYSNMVFEYIS